LTADPIKDTIKQVICSNLIHLVNYFTADKRVLYMPFVVVPLITVVLVTLLFGASPAQAASWWQMTSSDTIGNGVWSEQPENSGYPSPHGGFTSTSNLCKACHAVHGSGETSWRLLKDGSTDETRTQGERQGENGMGNKRSTECMYCHDATSGTTAKKPYELAVMGYPIRGEHALGATTIPDSSVNETSATDPNDKIGYLTRDGVLDCYQCHSVHGANTLTEVTAWGWGNATEAIDNFILRDDPAGNGGNANDGIAEIKPPEPGGWKDGKSKADPAYPAKDSTPYDPYGEYKYEVMNAWCGDCHNQNPNITGPDDFRPNNMAHPEFGGDSSTDTTDAGAWLEVYGQETKVAGGAPKGCDGCHMSGQKLGELAKMYWPHQAEGAKFLVRSDAATTMIFEPVEEGSKTGPGDSQRVIPGMDKACYWCHQFEQGSQGVGKTY
jgi:hypothetical protein